MQITAEKAFSIIGQQQAELVVLREQAQQNKEAVQALLNDPGRLRACLAAALERQEAREAQAAKAKAEPILNGKAEE